MFVLKNAWSSIVRRKWRTLLTMFIAIIVTFGTLFGFSVLHADESATDGYNPQLVSAVIPSQRIDCLLAIAVAGVAYLVLVVVLKIITADDCALLPKGEKIARILRIR